MQESDGSTDGSDRVEEHDIWLDPHDVDHLNDGAPVYKGIGEDVLLVLRHADWDEINALSDTDTDHE